MLELGKVTGAKGGDFSGRSNALLRENVMENHSDPSDSDFSISASKSKFLKN